MFAPLEKKSKKYESNAQAAVALSDGTTERTKRAGDTGLRRRERRRERFEGQKEKKKKATEGGRLSGCRVPDCDVDGTFSCAAAAVAGRFCCRPLLPPLPLSYSHSAGIPPLAARPAMLGQALRASPGFGSAAQVRGRERASEGSGQETGRREKVYSLR